MTKVHSDLLRGTILRTPASCQQLLRMNYIIRITQVDLLN